MNEIVEEIQTYVILPDAETRAATLWIVSSHGFTAWRIFPRLRIKAPERDCGKSTARDTIAPMTARELSIDGATASWIFRSIEMHRPTLLIDEADSFVQDNEELRGLLNSGHKKDGTVGRVVGEDLEPRNFSTFCPMVLVSIGALPATVESRSIPITIKRKRPDEKVSRLQDRDIERLKTTVARKIARFVKDHFNELAASDPSIPEDLGSNRAADNWRPLFAVATLPEANGPILPGKPPWSYPVNDLPNRANFAQPERDRVKSEQLPEYSPRPPLGRLEPRAGH